MTDFPNKQSVWASHIYCFKDDKHSSKKDELISHVYDLKNQGKTSGVSDISKKNLFESKFDFFNSDWTHITNNNGYHDAHKHLNTSWGGIYYVNAGECGMVADENGDSRMNGSNRFYSPIQYFTLDQRMQYLRHDVADVSPEDGVLVIFPAYLLHSATPYIGEKDRIVISFNAVINQRP